MVAVAAMALVTTSALSAALSVPVGRVVIAVLVAATPALVASVFPSARAAATLMILSVPATLLTAGVPARALVPRAWPHLLRELGSGALQPMVGAGPWTFTSGLLAALVLVAGASWTAGAVLGAPGLRGRDQQGVDALRALAGFALILLPWLAPLSEGSPGRSAWQGAVVLTAGVLWFCEGRAAPALALVVAVPAAALAGAIGPSRGWFGLAGKAAVNPAFSSLAIDPTYGRLGQRRTGATMLMVTAPAPGLWGMETLDYTDGSWIADDSPLPRLPEPAARREVVRVRVVGLRENLAVAPGRIERVSGPNKAERADGGSMVLEPLPVSGDSYRVTASVVDVTASQLSRDRAPLPAAARAYTRLVAPSSGRSGREVGLLAPFLAFLRAGRRPVVDPRVAALARGLAHGARTEWEIVMRVEQYLTGGGRFRYTTKVGVPGPQPLVDFLLRTHAGYCQHFAGAAALLLRLAGVPARVVTGFATGQRVGAGRYDVRDLDAHEWIEAYFPGDGWVPFNPTPAAAPALVAGGVDSRPPVPRPTWGDGDAYLAVGLAAVLSAGAVRYRRRRRHHGLPPATEYLWRVAHFAGVPSEASTTLAQARAVLASRIGPRTAKIADDLERERFARAPCAPHKRPCIRLVRALLGDLGPVRALRFLCGARPCAWANAATPHMTGGRRSGGDRPGGQRHGGSVGAS
jgi:transglutaminase-like putative cysteine protease